MHWPINRKGHDGRNTGWTMARLLVALTAAAMLTGLSGCGVALVAGGAAIAIATAGAQGDGAADAREPTSSARAPAEPMTAQPKPPGAIAYHLPRVEFEVALTRRLKSCAQGGQVQLTAEVTPRYVADPRESHVIDRTSFPKDLAGMPLDVALYDNGTIRLVNAVGDAAAAEPIPPFSGGSVQSSGVSSPTGSASDCTEETFRHLEATAIASMTTKHGKRVARTHRGKAGKSDGTVSLAKAEAYLTDTQRYVFRPLNNDPRVVSGQWQMALEPNAAVMERWFGKATPDRRALLTAHAAVHVPDWTPPEPAMAECNGDRADTSTCAPRQPMAVVYRQPVGGTLMVCKDMCLGFDDKPVSALDKVILSKAVDVPQAGRLGRLPFRTPKSEGKTLAVRFTPAGSLTHVSYTAGVETPRVTTTH